MEVIKIKGIIEIDIPSHCVYCRCSTKDEYGDYYCILLDFKEIPIEGRRKDCPIKAIEE